MFCFQLILTLHFPFKLSGKVMQVLMGIFLYHDFSVRNFIKGIQVQSPFEIQHPPSPLARVSVDLIQIYGKQMGCFVLVQLALLEHFHSQPLSVLCCKKKDALLNVMQLSHRDLERVRHLLSFKRCVCM